MNSVKKKIYCFFLTVVFLLCFSSSGVLALSKDAQQKKVTISVNEQVIKTDVDPYITEGRTMVPFRALFEAIGAEVGYSTHPALKVWGEKDSLRVDLTLGKKSALVNGREVELDTMMELKNNRTFVPLRFVSTSLGCEVEWDQEQYMVRIASKKDSPEKVREDDVEVDDNNEQPGFVEKVIYGAQFLASATREDGSKAIQYGNDRYNYAVNEDGTVTGTMDCSSFIEYVFQRYAGIKIGAHSAEQVKTGLKGSFNVVAVDVYCPESGLDIALLKPGDLVFFQNTYNAPPPTHVGIYIGDGMFVHMSTSANGPVVDRLLSKYWKDRWYAARRIIN